MLFALGTGGREGGQVPAERSSGGAAGSKIAPMGQMTAEDRARAVEGLERSRDAFLAAVAGLTPEQWRFQPGEGRWSVAECADHVLVIERLLLDTAKGLAACPADPERAARVQGKDERLLKALADRGFKVRNPFPSDPTGEGASPERLAAAFRQLRSSAIEYAATTSDSLRDHVARHPLLKDLDGVQWLLLISAHCQRHTAQIEEVKTDPHYPRAFSAETA